MAQPVMYEQMVFPTRFVWAYGGKQVRLFSFLFFVLYTCFFCGGIPSRTLLFALQWVCFSHAVALTFSHAMPSGASPP